MWRILYTIPTRSHLQLQKGNKSNFDLCTTIVIGICFPNVPLNDSSTDVWNSIQDERFGLTKKILIQSKIQSMNYRISKEMIEKWWYLILNWPIVKKNQSSLMSTVITTKMQWKSVTSFMIDHWTNVFLWTLLRTLGVHQENLSYQNLFFLARYWQFFSENEVIKKLIINNPDWINHFRGYLN